MNAFIPIPKSPSFRFVITALNLPYFQLIFFSHLFERDYLYHSKKLITTLNKCSLNKHLGYQNSFG